MDVSEKDLDVATGAEELCDFEDRNELLGTVSQ